MTETKSHAQRSTELGEEVDEVRHQLSEALDDLSAATRRAEAAEAACAQIKNDVGLVLADMGCDCADGDGQPQGGCAMCMVQAAILQPNPGQALLERMKRMEALLSRLSTTCPHERNRNGTVKTHNVGTPQ